MANIVTNLLGGMTVDKLSGAFTAAKSAAKGIDDHLASANKSASGLASKMKSIGGIAKGVFGGAKGLGTGQTGNLMEGALGSFSGMSSAASSMTNAFGSGQGSMEESLRKILQPDKADTGAMFSNVMSGLQQFMPDVKSTVTRAAGYYNATMYAGNRFPRATSGLQALIGTGMPSVEDMTFKTLSATGGITSVGSDALVAKYLLGRGMTVSADPNSTYQRTLRAIGNAGKYMNISNEAAAASIENLTSGQGSANMLRKFGIYTADIVTGKEKTQGQIFEELAQRFTAGQEPMTVENTLNDIRRGFLGVNIQNAFGNDQAGAEMFKQYMIERAAGTKLDLSDQNAMEQLYGKLGTNRGGAQGNENPLKGIYQMNISDTAQLDKAEESYLAGMHAAVPALQALNEAAGLLAATMGGVTNGFMTMFQGSKSAQGIGKAAGSYVDWTIANQSNALKAALPYAIQGNLIGAALAAAPHQANYLAGNVLLGATALTGVASTVITGGMDPNNDAPINRERRNQGGPNPDGDKASGLLVSPIPGALPVKGGGYNDKSGIYYETTGRPHMGFDLQASDGKPVKSVCDGRVTVARGDKTRYYLGSSLPRGGTKYDKLATNKKQIGLGLRVHVLHEESGYTFVYGHLSSIKVKEGDYVKKGQLLGLSGHSGGTTGPHLHFEVQDRNGNKVNPKTVIAKLNASSMQPNASGTASSSSGAISASGAQGILDQTAGAVGTGSAASFFGASATEIQAIYAGLTSGNPTLMQGAVSTMVALSNKASGKTSGGYAGNTGTSGSSTAGNTVNIEVKIPEVSETEAAKFARLVKQYLENDTLTSNMGSL